MPWKWNVKFIAKAVPQVLQRRGMRERRLLEELLRTCKKNTEKKRATKEPPAAILGGRASPKKAMQVVIQGEIRPGTKL
jgi:hypothetical protein